VFELSDLLVGKQDLELFGAFESHATMDARSAKNGTKNRSDQKVEPKGP
jgi:hypothetical protein